MDSLCLITMRRTEETGTLDCTSGRTASSEKPSETSITSLALNDSCRLLSSPTSLRSALTPPKSVPDMVATSKTSSGCLSLYNRSYNLTASNIALASGSSGSLRASATAPSRLAGLPKSGVLMPALVSRSPSLSTHKMRIRFCVC